MNDYDCSPSRVQQPTHNTLSSVLSVNSFNHKSSDSIKIEYQNDIKIIPRVTQFPKFLNLVLHRFEELSYILKSSQGKDPKEMLKFTYEDQEKDIISISNDIDLEEAIDQAKPGKTLKIYI